MSFDHLRPETRAKLTAAIRAELARRQLERDRAGELEASLSDFHREAWPYIDPANYIHNWHIDAMAEHLEAVTWGHLRRLIITVPPRCMKSLMVSVSWQAWTWAQSDIGPLSGPHVKFANISYSPKLSIRDAIKTKRLIRCNWYRERWGERFDIMSDKDQNAMFENSSGGFRFSTSVSGELTGEGADILTVDDPINAKKATWDSAREEVNNWWDEAVPTRLNDQRTGAKVLIMQRLHEEDLVGHILDKESEDWVVLNLPMRHDPALDTRTYINGAEFFVDPRAESGEELLWPERFPETEVTRLETELGPFAAAAQLQQQPTPKGGGIIERGWWQTWPAPGFEPKEGEPLTYPPCSFIVGSIDTAYGVKDTDAWNAMTTWGVWEDRRRRPATVMMSGWRARCRLMGIAKPGDDPLISPGGVDQDPRWGLVERVLHTIRRRRLDAVLIEDKTRAKDLSAELERLLRDGECMVLLVPPVGDKVARMNAVQALFAGGLVWAPDMTWADTVITEVSRFPKSKWKDYADTVSQALSWLRSQGLVKLGPEADADNYAADLFRPTPKPVYDV